MLPKWVWAFLGDGEMDEPESRGLLQLAANDGLDNLIFVANFNLLRLDGPVCGNGKIIQGTRFRGAGWNVMKVLWGREWDPLLAADAGGDLVRIVNETPDGDFPDGPVMRVGCGGRRASRSTPQPLTIYYVSPTIYHVLPRGGHRRRPTCPFLAVSSLLRRA